MSPDATTWTLIYYLCAAPLPGVPAMSCEARQASAPTCELAVAAVEAGLNTQDYRYFAAGCLVLHAPQAVRTPRRPRVATAPTTPSPR
jgi:hypothetical protein